MGEGATGFQDTLFQDVLTCDVHIGTEVHAKVVLPSDTTMFQWTSEHMTKELTAMAPRTRKVKDVLLNC